MKLKFGLFSESRALTELDTLFPPKFRGSKLNQAKQWSVVHFKPSQVCPVDIIRHLLTENNRLAAAESQESSW